MFFKQVRRNAMRDRRKNSLFFGSMVAAIISFYSLLSLPQQDVMKFLKEMESDAIAKLMGLVPVVYAVALFFIFFLVFFAVKSDLSGRYHEFGLYLMLGMKRSRLIAMIFLENLLNSLISLAIGIVAALLLTELTSLLTAKLVGLGILGHSFSPSFGALFFTVLGFLIVSLLSTLIICVRISRMEPVALFHAEKTAQKKPVKKESELKWLTVGSVLLILAYAMGLFLMPHLFSAVIAVLIFGALGTFAFLRGVGGLVELRTLKKSEDQSGLARFTGRQIQENVSMEYKTLAVTSLLLLLAVTFLVNGLGAAAGLRGSDSRSVDCSVFGTDADFEKLLADPEIEALIANSYQMRQSNAKDYEAINGDALKAAYATLPSEQLRGAGSNLDLYRVISESSYSKVQEALGKEPLNLAEDEAALFTSIDNPESYFRVATSSILEQGAGIEIGGKAYKLRSTLYTDNIVADRAITLWCSVIVPDSVYDEIAKETSAFCLNLQLKDEVVKDIGLMQGLIKLTDVIKVHGLRFESYIAGIGRMLFFAVATSYLSLFLGFMFLIIANTALAMKFFMIQQQNRRRYKTLLMLGADRDAVCDSAAAQIKSYFSLVLGLTALSSVFGVSSLFLSFLKLPATASFPLVLGIAAAALIGIVVIEIIYISAVKRTVFREIRSI